MANTRLKFHLLSLCILVSQMTEGVFGQCSTPPMNQAVYETAQNTMMACNSPVNVSWGCKPTNAELSTIPITNFSNTVTNSSLKLLFDVILTNLNIKIAQSPSAPPPPIATAGIYVAQYSPNNRVGAKLVVVRGPPTCNCTAINSTSISITCSIEYADSSFHPIYAKMTWTADGVYYRNDTQGQRTKVNGGWTSTSIIITSVYDPRVFQCTVTLTKPTDIQYPWIATNAPLFSANCTPNFCGGATTTLPKLSTVPPTTIPPPNTTIPPPNITIPPPTTTITPFSATTTPPTTTTAEPSTTECTCTPTTACPPDQNCTKTSECRSDGTDLSAIYDECVVKAELYARCDNCCPDDLVCGVVVTLRNDSRWLIHDSSCDDSICEMVVVDASCMSSDWKLLSDRRVTISGVGDYVQAGNSVQLGLNVTDCSESCRRMMNLP